MNKQEALTILQDLKFQETNPILKDESTYNEPGDNDQFITIWKNYESRSIVYCNTINEAIEEINKLDSKNNIIAMEIDDHFMSSLNDWICEIF